MLSTTLPEAKETTAPLFNIPEYIKKIKLVFDVNGTLMSGDTEKAKFEAKKNAKEGDDIKKLQDEHMGRVLWKTLAENYTGKCPDGSDKNFRDYLEEKYKITAGKKLTTEQYFDEFTTFLKEYNLPLYEKNAAFVERVLKQLENGFVFESLICLLNELKKAGIQVEIELRTFGSDGELILDELAERTELFPTVIEVDANGKEKKKINGVIRGKIDENGLLNINDKTIDPSQLDKEISSHTSNVIVLIRDNYSRWRDYQGQYSDHGKPIFIDATDPSVLIGVFDDNMQVVGVSKRGGIISVKTNALGADNMSQQELQDLFTSQHFLFNVNELPAIQNSYYYVDLFKLMLTQKLYPNMLLDALATSEVAPTPKSVLITSKNLNTPGVGIFAQTPVASAEIEVAAKTLQSAIS